VTLGSVIRLASLTFLSHYYYYYYFRFEVDDKSSRLKTISNETHFSSKEKTLTSFYILLFLVFSYIMKKIEKRAVQNTICIRFYNIKRNTHYAVHNYSSL